ncbi:PREDICTED: HAUS augmin-like complex subunit 3 [Nanorana parkeri]|uniref:HAUS augmin-like complex subunit 3 n=1 Tax=Nanorana parkeri TaxID=125878 RepID=UPI000854E39C|nr:PREDICTED: HAUS augmin-like complex subunit 3 [Nanorana parkeri]
MAKLLNAPPTSRLSRQRSTCFLLDSAHVKGSDFVEMLHLIGYPGAQDLKGEDFDWLCEGSEELEVFLSWLCSAVDQKNVLTSEQLEAYDALLDSGQPLLEADELQDLCHGANEAEGDSRTEHTKSLEELEAELQSLQTLKAHRLQCRNKLESLGLTLFHSRLSLEKVERQEEKCLSNTKEELSTLNSRCNAALVRLREMATELGDYHTGKSCQGIFLSSVDLDGYIKLEETCWKQVEQNAMEALPVKEEDLEKERKAHTEMEKESNRVRTAWSSQKIQLSFALATLNGNMEALKWLDRNVGEQVWDPQRLPLMEREVQMLEAEVESLQLQRLPPLVCEASVGLCLHAHQGWVHTERQRLAWIDQEQAPVAEAVLSQLSRLQLVELGLQVEMREYHRTERDLRTLKTDMGSLVGELGRRILGPREPWTTPQWLPPIRVDSKDHTAVRLSVMLENPSRQKELFPKYEALQRQAGALLQEMTALSTIHDGPLPQTSSLEHCCEELQHCLCRGTRNLQLRDPTLTQAFEALYSGVAQFNQCCLECLRDLEKKKQSIQTSYLEQERQFYVLFYQNSTLLAQLVQDMEQRVKELQTD